MARRVELAAISLAVLLCLSSGLTLTAAASDGQTGTPAPSVNKTADVGERFAAATHALEAGDATTALQRAEDLQRERPDLPGLQYVLGSATYRLGRLMAAEHALRLAVAEDPKNVDAKRLLGLTLYRLGRPKDALIYLESSQGDHASDSDAAYVLGMCYVDVNRFDRARAAFASQYNYPPDSAAAFLVEGQLLLRANLKGPAQDAIEQALARSAHLPLAHYALGEIALAREDIAQALAHFTAEAENNPGYSRTFDRIGDAYIRQGDLRNAQIALNRAIILDPSQTGPYILLGKLMLKKSDPATAILYLRRAEKMDASNYMTHALLGQALRATKRYDEASQETRLAMELQNAAAPKLQQLQ